MARQTRHHSWGEVRPNGDLAIKTDAGLVIAGEGHTHYRKAPKRKDGELDGRSRHTRLFNDYVKTLREWNSVERNR